MVPKGKSRLVGNLDMPERSHKALPLRKKVCVCRKTHSIHRVWYCLQLGVLGHIPPTDKGGLLYFLLFQSFTVGVQIVGLSILFYSRDECKAITKHPFGLPSMFPLCE